MAYSLQQLQGHGSAVLGSSSLSLRHSEVLHIDTDVAEHPLHEALNPTGPSNGPRGTVSPTVPSAFPTFTVPFADDPRTIRSLRGSFDGYQVQSPHPRLASLPSPHGPCLSNFSDGHYPPTPISAHVHRSSVSGAGPFPSQEWTSNMMDDTTLTSPVIPRFRGSAGRVKGTRDVGSIGITYGAVRTQDHGMESDGSPKGDQPEEERPAWSELKTKAGKDRKRLPLACTACRRKKIRCSGEKPSCKHCSRSRIPCVYKLTSRKAAPRTDYMAMLDKRLRRMEDRVIKAIPKEEAKNIAATDRAVVKPSLPPAAPAHGSAKKRSADEAFRPERSELASISGVNGVYPDRGSATPTAFSRYPHSGEKKLMTEGAEHLPPKEIQEHLAEVYFDCVYAQSYHLLHKPSFMRNLKAGILPPVLVLAVCAISARFSTHPDLRSEPAFLRGEQWAKHARDIALRWYDTPNITIVIVYLILGLHEFGTCHRGRSWMFCGMAQRMAYALQLHRDPDNGPCRLGIDGKAEISVADKETRRRTMWACYLMDRFNSSGSERPMFVNEQYLSVQLPIKEQHYQMEIPGSPETLEGKILNSAPPEMGDISNARENMGVAAYFVRIVSIWGQLVNYMNLGGKERDPHPLWSPESMYAQLQNQVTSFQDSLPPLLHYSSENLQIHAAEKIANQFLLLHICYNQVILFMNRFALPSAARSRHPANIPKAFLAESAKRALRAASTISLLVKEGLDHALTAPFAGYCAFLSSTAHIRGVFSKNKDLEERSKRCLGWNIRFLVKMKKVWGMFHYLVDNLKELWRQHAAVAAGGLCTASTPPAGKSTPAESPGAKIDSKPIFQYGDWYSVYPSGVSMSGFEEPAREQTSMELDAFPGHGSDLQSVEEFSQSLPPVARTSEAKTTIEQRKSKDDRVKRRSLGEAKRKPEPKRSRKNKPRMTLAPQDQPPGIRSIIATQQQEQLSTDLEFHPIFSQPQQTAPRSEQQQQHYQSYTPLLPNNNGAPSTSPLTPHHNSQPHIMSLLDTPTPMAPYTGLHPSPSAADINFPHLGHGIHHAKSHDMETIFLDFDPANLGDLSASWSASSGAAGGAANVIQGGVGVEALTAFEGVGAMAGVMGMGTAMGNNWYLPFNIAPPEAAVGGAGAGSGYTGPGMTMTLQEKRNMGIEGGFGMWALDGDGGL